jgi:pyruvate-ferredoxin/flavodoxin oxidoreductase
MTEEEAKAAPEGMQIKDLVGMPGYKFAIVVSALDCTGCGSCQNVCPGMKGEKALSMVDLEANAGEQKYFDYGVTTAPKQEVIDKFKETTVKGSQFKKPLLEFSGACAGCGETPYAKLVTQLFGDRMYIANATGCSSIWGNSSPSTPYTVDFNGHGPAWSNSLFEDNAEFGYGMLLAQNAIRANLADKVQVLADKGNEAAKEWLETMNQGVANGRATDKLLASLEGDASPEAKELVKNKDFLAKKSQWIFGGDGWAFDIDFGGLDHVLASGQDVNVLVMNTEVYSNTGGQSSKATPLGAVAQFAAGGKETKQKDLASIAMSYGYVYVAQIAMGADMNQAVKAIAEAEAYPGPSLIIAYAPCINHHIKVKGGMSKVMDEEKAAVQTGYWNLFRYNPDGEKKFSLDSKAASAPYSDFLNREARYTSLQLKNPEKAEKLFTQAAKNAEQHYAYLQKLNDLYNN